MDTDDTGNPKTSQNRVKTCEVFIQFGRMQTERLLDCLKITGHEIVFFPKCRESPFVDLVMFQFYIHVGSCGSV